MDGSGEFNLQMRDPFKRDEEKRVLKERTPAEVDARTKKNGKVELIVEPKMEIRRKGSPARQSITSMLKSFFSFLSFSELLDHSVVQTIPVGG